MKRHPILFVAVLAACSGESSNTPDDPQRAMPPPVHARPVAGAASKPSIGISPSNVAVVESATQRFVAKTSGLRTNAVRWSVLEPTGCGSISANGEYTAPAAAATCHVVVASDTDLRMRATATVVVTELSVGGMPHVSVGKPAFASEGDATLLTDGAYRAPHAWTFSPSSCSPSAPCWAAVHVGAGPTRLLVDWSYEDGQGDFDTLAYGGATVTDYSILVSSDSTNGADGTWTTATDSLTHQPATVGANTLIHRTQLVDFTGDAWVKIAITASTANELDELDLWDATSTTDDTFFFHGDSITHRCANLRGGGDKGEQPSFQADVQAASPTHYPLQVGGGIVGHTAGDADTEVAKYLMLFRPVKYWFLTMGTNDLCAGAAAFTVHAQAWIDAVKGAGAVPILVHPIWGNDNGSYCSDNGPSFNEAVDELVKANGLMPAVPLYEATVGHPEYFDGGDVHPNPAGCAVWNQVFAQAVAGFYH